MIKIKIEDKDFGPVADVYDSMGDRFPSKKDNKDAKQDKNNQESK